MSTRSTPWLVVAVAMAACGAQPASPRDRAGATSPPIASDRPAEQASDAGPGCPSSFSVVGMACSEDQLGAQCRYREGSCTCLKGGFTGGCSGAQPSAKELEERAAAQAELRTWHCTAKPGAVDASGCPFAQPARGGRCQLPSSRTCYYSAGCTSEFYGCRDGAWALVGGQGPPP